MLSPIRIPVEDEFQFTIGGRTTGTPIETNRDWESAVYEIWSPYRTYEHILFQIDMLRADIRYHTLRHMHMKEEVFQEKKQSIVEAMSSIRDFLREHPGYHKVVIDSVYAMMRTAMEYQESQR